MNSKASVNALDPVSNGTVLGPKVVEYVERYRGYAKRTAEAIIGLATTFVEAKEKLNKEEFALFCKEIKIEKNSSTYKKWMKIGNEAIRFSEYTENLPNTWTTLYQLAKLTLNEFAGIASRLTPSTTAKEINELTGTGESASSIKESSPDFTISLDGVDPEDKLCVWDELRKLESRYGFSLSVAEATESEMAGIAEAQYKSRMSVE